MYTLIVRLSFEAAHDIPGHAGKCARLHGHSYRMEAEFAAQELNSLGMVADLTDLKAVINSFLPDHVYLNNVMAEPTTVENIARWIFDRLAERTLPVAAVTVWETEKNGCRYTPDPRQETDRSAD